MPVGMEFTASGGTGPYTFVFSALPPGLSVTNSSNTQSTVSGIPSQVGVFSFSATVTDVYGCTVVSAVHTLTVSCATVAVSVPTVSTALAGFALPAGLQFAASGGSTPYTFIFSALPASLTVSGSSNFDRYVVGTPNAAGVYPISVTATDAYGCTAVSPAYSLTVDCPTITLGTPSLVHPNCQGETKGSLTVSPSGGAGPYSFTLSGVVSDTNATGSFTALGTGSYTIRVADANGCSTTSGTLSLTANPYSTLTASVAGSGTLTCTNLSVVVNVMSNAMYVVLGPGNPVAGPNGFTATQPGTFTIATMPTGMPPFCLSQTVVTVNQSADAPTINSFVSSNSLNCSLTSATLTAMASTTAPGTLNYAFAGTGLTNPNAVAGTAVVSSGNSFTMTVTNTTNGCSSSAITTVNSNTTAPGVTISPASPMLTCTSPTLTLTALSAGSTFRWSDNSTASTLVVSTTGTYSVTATSANGCSGTTSVAVTSNFAGAVPIPTLTSSGSTVCVGTNVVITASVSGPASAYQWFRNGQLAGSGSATLALGNVQSAQAGNYVLVVTGGCGSATTTTTFNLAVNPEPNVVITFPNGSTVIVNGLVPTITVSRSSNPTMQVSGGSQYERMALIDRVNGYELRQVDTNANGIFSITRAGLFRLTITGPTGCKKIVEGIVQLQP